MKKTIISMLLITIAALAFTGCGGNSTSITTNPPETSSANNSDDQPSSKPSMPSNIPEETQNLEPTTTEASFEQDIPEETGADAEIPEEVE